MRRRVVAGPFTFALLAGAAALGSPARAQQGGAAEGRRIETIGHADLIIRANPEGIMLVTGGFRRWSGPLDPRYGVTSSHLQVGAVGGVNPAYAQGAVYAEWKAAPFVQTRLQVDGYRYFGTLGALLSFPTAGAKFGPTELRARRHQEEATWARRVLLQPVLMAKVGPVIFRNTTDVAFYRFDGTGPYFYEWEYDTLLDNADRLVDNTAAVLFEARRGPEASTLLVGPFHQVTDAARASITRQRIGIQAYWSAERPLASFRNPRLYGRIGVNLQDRNRERGIFFIAGTGIDF